MGFWSKLGGAAMMVGGVVAAPATGGASLALVPAGAGMIGNDIKKEGAQKAASQQEAAANKAIAGQEKAAAAAQQAYAPYTQTGGAAMGALGAFMGLPATFGQTAGPPGGAVARDTGIPFGSLPAGTQEGLGVRTPAADASRPAPPAVQRHPATTPQTQAAQAQQSSYIPPALRGDSVGTPPYFPPDVGRQMGQLGGVGGGVVQMRAPTGQVQWVPRAQAPFYAQRGAVEVG